MVMLNLLPWRESEQSYHKKALIRCMLLVFSMCVLFISIIYFHTERRKQVALHRIKILRETITQLSDKKPLTDLSIPIFSRDRAAHWVRYHADGLRLFAELSRASAEHVCWTSIERKKNKVLFMGRTDSAFDLTELLKNWHAAYLFSQIKLENMSLYHAPGWEFKLKAMPRTILPSAYLEREEADD